MNAFVQAKNYTHGRKGALISLIVIHTMESPEGVGTALAVATWFAGEQAPEASAHYCIDDKDVIQCVGESDIAWGAPGANAIGLHLEHAGRANQTPEQWDDEYSRATLERSAALCADLCRRYGIPIKRLSADEVRAGGRGICGHVDVTKAFPERKGTHWDPGPNFPWARYLELVIAADGMGDVKPDATV
jgi:N-acetyl-anhydromuramyl-L-alanine amidase AmpD